STGAAALLSARPPPHRIARGVAQGSSGESSGEGSGFGGQGSGAGIAVALRVRGFGVQNRRGHGHPKTRSRSSLLNPEPRTLNPPAQKFSRPRISTSFSQLR